MKLAKICFEQYGRRNNIEISGIPDSVEKISFREKVVSIFSNNGVGLRSNDTEACHIIEKIRDNSKNTIVRFNNIKFVKEALYNMKKLISIDK